MDFLPNFPVEYLLARGSMATAWLFIGAELALQLGTILAVLLSRRSTGPVVLAWLLLVLVVPLIGAMLYWTFGTPWLSHRRQKRCKQVSRRLQELRRIDRSAHGSPHHAQQDVMHRLLPAHRGLAALASSISGDGPLGGNVVKAIRRSTELFECMAEDIDRAQHSVHLEFYIAIHDVTSEKVFNALKRAAARGVACRAIFDAIGSRPFLRSASCQSLRDANVEVVAALPVGLFRMLFNRIDLRNHRKLVVIDSWIAFTGSHNLADGAFKIKKRFAPWVDAGLRIEGPIAADLQRIFLEDWFLETGRDLSGSVPMEVEQREGGTLIQALATGPITYSGAMPQIVVSLVHLAQQELILTTPYFVPDEPTHAALATAARRGVRTVLVVPKRNDSWLVEHASRHFFSRLLEAGVEIWEFKKGLLHAKTIVVDGQVSLMTSANLDRRSFELNLELALVLYDAAASADIRRLQDGYLQDSVRINRERWEQRGAHHRIVENLCGILAPIL
ncbi:MAG: cardiolipin synthase [Phycisphaerales bacterium]|nr:cardiolipin synthase [Phycisphaerales bacterium]